MDIVLDSRQLRTCAVCFDLTVGLMRVSSETSAFPLLGLCWRKVKIVIMSHSNIFWCRCFPGVRNGGDSRSWSVYELEATVRRATYCSPFPGTFYYAQHFFLTRQVKAV